MSTAILSSEFKLMLSCCRIIPGNKELGQREDAFAETIDEDYFWALALRHRIYPIVWFNLQREARLSMGLKEKLKQFPERRISVQIVYYYKNCIEIAKNIS